MVKKGAMTASITKKYRPALILATTLASLFFIGRGYIFPFCEAFTDLESHAGLRPGYFGAFDLRYGLDPYERARRFTVANPSAHPYQMDRDGFGYFPLVEVAYLPLTFLSFPLAKAVFLSLNLLVVAWSVWLLVGLADLKKDALNIVAMILMVVCYVPIMKNMDAGQNNLFILLLLILGMKCLSAGRDVMAGALFAVCLLVKPSLVFFPIVFVLKRRFSVLMGIALTLGVSFLASVLVFGWKLHASFLKAIWEEPAVYTWWSIQNLLASLMRLLSYTDGNPEIIPWLQHPVLAWMLWGVGVIVLGAMACFVTLRFPKMPILFSLSVWVVLTMLIVKDTYDGRLVWLLPALCLLMMEGIRRAYKWQVAGVILAYGMLIVPVVKFSSFPIFHQGPLLIFSNTPTVGMLLLFGLLFGTGSRRDRYRGSMIAAEAVPI